VGGEVIPSNVYYSDFGRDAYIPPGTHRSLTVGFVVAEEVIRAAESLVVALPCPGLPEESLEFEFLARGSDAAP
jgi:hypothetical protein